jgi:hypothetical protein
LPLRKELATLRKDKKNLIASVGVLFEENQTLTESAKGLKDGKLIVETEARQEKNNAKHYKAQSDLLRKEVARLNKDNLAKEIKRLKADLETASHSTAKANRLGDELKVEKAAENPKNLLIYLATKRPVYQNSEYILILQ